MLKAKAICKNVSTEIRPQAVALADAVIGMQKKIEQHLPELKGMPLSIEVTVGTGETVPRANPAIQEFRALVRDYSAALKNLRDIIGEGGISEEESSLDSLKSKIKVG